MPLNQPKTYKFGPNPVGAVKMFSRSSRRSRLWTGGSFWRSIERGESANLIQISCVEDQTLDTPEAVLVVRHTGLKSDEQIFANGFSQQPVLNLFELSIQWDEEIRLTKEEERIVARKYGIRWQIAGAPAGAVRAELGTVPLNRVFKAEGVSFKLDSNLFDWVPGTSIVLRPRVHRYPLVVTSVTDPTTSQSTIGWNIDALRASLNGSDTWVTMPERPQVELRVSTSTSGGSSGSGSEEGGSGSGSGTTTTTVEIIHHTDGPHEDGMDHGEDDFFLSTFAPTNMGGGDGLPANPVGYNTGPDRVLMHLNYSELDNGSLGELNQVFEWVGESATSGSWQRYA